jgi:hypothetical protein
MMQNIALDMKGLIVRENKAMVLFKPNMVLFKPTVSWICQVAVLSKVRSLKKAFIERSLRKPG